MKDTIELTDPEDVAASREWAARRAAALAALQRARARRAMLADALSRDSARMTLDALAAAQAASARASDTLGTARSLKEEARLRAERYEANDLALAQQAVDDATRAVSAALAELLSEATASAALTATVDGLALRARFRTAMASRPALWDVATIPFRAHPGEAPLDPQLDFPALEDANFAPILELLRRLDERVDAVVDLLTAEGVHHLVNGNPVRSGAALDIAATGSVPDDLDVIRTPSNGHDVTHRVLLVRGTGQEAAWRADPPGIAAVADPELAALVSTFLPDPAQVHLVAERIDPDPGTASQTLSLTADALGLDPLAWLRAAADDAELTARVARVARDAWAASLGSDALSGRIVVRDPEPRDPRALALGDLLTAARAVRRVLATARALAPPDFAIPSSPATASDDAAVADAVRNVAEAEQRVGELLTALEAAAGATAIDPILDALLAASAVGIGEAAPALDVEVPAPAVLQARAALALGQLRARTAGGPFHPTPGDPQATLDGARERLVQLCGSRLPLLIAVAPPAESLVREDLGRGPVRMEGADRVALREWLHDHARVRTATAALQEAYGVAEVLGCPAVLDPRATQLPAADPDRWVEDDPAPRPGVVNLVVVRAYPGEVPAQITGLTIDAWTSVVPATTHATGLAFHYDEPDATPAQAVLVAVAPDVRPDRLPLAWDLDTLIDVVRSTFALASERGAAAELWPGAAVTLFEEA